MLLEEVRDSHLRRSQRGEGKAWTLKDLKRSFEVGANNHKRAERRGAEPGSPRWLAITKHKKR